MLVCNRKIGIRAFVLLGAVIVVTMLSARDSKNQAECLILAKGRKFELLQKKYCEAMPESLRSYFEGSEGRLEYIPTLAAIMDDGDILRLLIQQGFDLRRAYINNGSPLEWAITRKSNNACKVILEHIWVREDDPVQYVQSALEFSMMCNNAKAAYTILEFCTPENWSPIAWAVSQKMHKVLGVILSDTTLQGVNWGTDPQNKSPLMLCVEKDMPEIAKTLLDAGANPLRQDGLDKPSPLDSAQQRGNSTLVIDFATVAARRATGNTHYPAALHWAVATNRLKIVKILLENRVDIAVKNNAGDTALHLACEQQSAEMIACLVQAGAPINAVNKQGFSPLDICARNADQTCLVALVAYADSIEEHDHPFGWNSLIMASRRGNLEAVQSLLKTKISVNYVDKEGNSSLHWAARFGHMAVAKALIECGADVNLKNQYGWSPLFWACKNHHAPVVRYLLEHGAETDTIKKNIWFLRYAQATQAIKYALNTLVS